MTWFNIGDKIAWVRNGKNVETLGVIKEILKQGECAEDYLTPEEQTKISTKHPNTIYRPDTVRALIEVTDNNGHKTYHIAMINRLRKIAQKETREHTTRVITIKRRT